MAGLLSRIKGGKKKGKQEIPPPPAEDVMDTSAHTESTGGPAENVSEPVLDIPSVQPPLPQTSPVSRACAVPVVQASSIFSGLHLSSTVAGSESPDFSCVKDPSGLSSKPEEEEESSFSFLSASEEAPEVNSGASQESPTQNVEEAGGFSFLAQPLAANSVAGEKDIIQDQSPSSVEQSEPSCNIVCQSEVVSQTSSSDQQSDVHVNTKSDSKKKVGQRLPPTSGEKKKKRKAIRPGQSVVIEDSRGPPRIIASSSDHPAMEPAQNETELKSGSNIEGDAVLVPTINLPGLSAIEDDIAPPLPAQANKNSDSFSPSEISEQQNLISSGLGSEPASPEAGEKLESSECIGKSQKATEDSVQKEARANYLVEFTHEETLAGLLQSYSNGLLRFRKNMLGAEELYRIQLDKQIKLTQNQVDRWLGDRLLKEKEAKALAEEDYELAEQLSKQLEATGQKAEQDIIASGLAVLKQWVQECAKEKESEAQFQSDMLTQLGSLRDEHNVVLEDLKKEHTSLLAKEKMQLQSLENEVEREAGHIALDCSHLEKREQLLEEEKSRRAVDFIGRKEQLTNELAEIEDEIRTLEAKLVSLRDRQIEIVAHIEAEDESIKKVEEELADERAQLKSERDVFEERRDKLSSQQNLLEQKRQAVESKEKRQEEERHSLEALVAKAAAVWGEMQGIEAVKGLREHQVQQLLNLIDQGHKMLLPSEELNQVEEKVMQKKGMVEERTTAVLTGQSDLGEQRKRVRDLQAQLLQIQESKKAAVTGRQFKEASRLAGESKSMSLQVEEQQERLFDAEQSMAASSQELAELSDELATMKEELTQLERKEDEGHIQALSQAISSLSSLSETFGEHVWDDLMSSWKQLYLLLMDSLCCKHGIEKKLWNSKSQLETPVPDFAEEKSIDSDESSQEQNLKARLIELETEIEKACQEENYDRAAELEEELQAIKNS